MIVLARAALVLLLGGLTASVAVAGGQGPAQTPEIRSSTEERVAVPEPSPKAMSYYQSGNAIWVFHTVLGLAISSLFVFARLSARLRDLAARIGRNWLGTLYAYFVLFTLISAVINLPSEYFFGFVREHSYGLSNQTLAKWLRDFGISLALELVFGLVLIGIPYALFLKSPKRWWLYTWLATIPFMFLMMVITPIWIDPLFNAFGPMKDKPLEGEILALASRAGIEGGKVNEVAKSVDTNKLNAYVTGLGPTKRIVLLDTLLKKLDHREVLAVMGHEMGHYVLGHVFRMMTLLVISNFFAFWLVHKLSGYILTRHAKRIGFDRLSDPASLPLLILFSQVFTLVGAPAVMAYSRYLEHEADRFAIEITRDNRAAAMAMVKLQESNLSNPRPGLLYKIWRSSHPPIGERIDFCNDYRPWRIGAPSVYGSYFRSAGASGSEPAARSTE